VKDLVAGSGIRFINHGLHTLDGLAGDWQLFKVERQEGLLRDEGSEEGKWFADDQP